MKIFPKTIYAWLNGNGQPVVEPLPDRLPVAEKVGIYELRAIKVVKRETVLEDVPPPDACCCPRYCAYHVSMSRSKGLTCTCSTQSDDKGTQHSGECYWLDPR